VALARERAKPIAEIAKDLRISESCLRNWIAQDSADSSAGNGGSSSRLTSDEKRELAQLRKDKRRLEIENEILKRAAAYFARENVLPK
jgi:transposase-like protein